MTQTNSITTLKQGLRGLAKRLEKRRKTYMVWLVIGIGLVSFAVTFVLLYLNPKGIDLKYTVTFGAFLPSLALYTILNKSYQKQNKRHFIKGLCEASGFNYRDDGCFAISTAEKHKILPKHNKGRLKDGMQGSMHGVPVRIQEVMLSELRQDPKHKKKKKEYVRFWGLLVSLGLRQSLNGHTVVIPHTAMQTFFRAYFANYKEVKIQEGRFPKRYEVTTTDTVEAKLIVNSRFRDQFMASGRAMEANWCEASFGGNEILLAYQRFQPLFDMSPLWKPVTEKILYENIEWLDGLDKLVATLKANKQVGL